MKLKKSQSMSLLIGVACVLIGVYALTVLHIDEVEHIHRYAKKTYVNVFEIQTKCLVQKHYGNTDYIILFPAVGQIQKFFLGDGILTISIVGARFADDSVKTEYKKRLKPFLNEVYLYDYGKRSFGLRGPEPNEFPIVGFKTKGFPKYFLFEDPLLDEKDHKRYIVPWCISIGETIRQEL